jgi:hypothetical protein
VDGWCAVHSAFVLVPSPRARVRIGFCDFNSGWLLTIQAKVNTETMFGVGHPIALV